MGDNHTALALAQRAFSRAKNREQRFNCLRLLCGLYAKVDPIEQYETAWKIGETSIQDDEHEEAAFIISYTLATMRVPHLVTRDRQEEYLRRVDAFSSTFPESKLFRVGCIHTGEDTESLLSQLNAVTGGAEIAEERRRHADLGKRQGHYIPLAVRPGRFHPYASNIAEIFPHLVKGANSSSNSAAVIVAARTNDSVVVRLGRPPIVDLASLFALVELNLFDALFKIWTVIAIPRVSLHQLAEIAQLPFLADDGLVDRTFASLRRHKNKILQPISAESSASTEYPWSEFQTIEQEVADGYSYLAFDQTTLAVSVNVPPEHTYTIYEVIALACEKRVLDDAAAQLARLQIASWHTHNAILTPDDIVALYFGLALRGPVSTERARQAQTILLRYLRAAGNSALARAAEALAIIIERSSDSRIAARLLVDDVFRETTFLPD